MPRKKRNWCGVPAIIGGAIVVAITMLLAFAGIRKGIEEGIGLAMESDPEVQQAIRRGVEKGVKQAIDEFRPKRDAIMVYEVLEEKDREEVNEEIGFAPDGYTRGKLFRYCEENGWDKITKALSSRKARLTDEQRVFLQLKVYEYDQRMRGRFDAK